MPRRSHDAGRFPRRPGAAFRSPAARRRRKSSPALGKKVNLAFGGSPIRKIYERVGAENEAGSEDTYVIYSDPEDLARNFPTGAMEKYAGDLYAKGRIVLEPIQRSSTCDVSGSQMREWLISGKEDFVSHLPACLPAEDVWNRLSSTARRLGRVRR